MGEGVATTAPKIHLRGLTRIFQTRAGAVPALEEIDLDIREGEFVSIVGPSGCGKTTLLRILAGLETPSSGLMEIRRSDPSKPANAMVFQEHSVFPWMSVAENIGYGLAMRGVHRGERQQVVAYYLNQIGLTGFRDLYPHQLSGGMKQRVSVARAFANDPEILLMDEPFAALDEQNKVLLQNELLRIWEETRKTVVFITHSIEEAAVLSDRIVVMTAHPGRVKAILDVEFARPREVYSVKADPRFGAFTLHVWELLRDEVLRAREQAAAAGAAR